MAARSKTWAIVFTALAAGCIAAAGAMELILKELIRQDWITEGWIRHRWTFQWVFVGLSAGLQMLAIRVGRPSRSACTSILCEHHLERYGKSHNVRVTVLAIRRYLPWKRLTWWLGEKLFGNKYHPREYLKDVARAPDVADSAPTVVRFHRREGVAGIAWDRDELWEKQDLPDFKDDDEAWYEYNSRKLFIPREKAEMLTRKCRSYVCTPIYAGTDRFHMRGVLSVDSMEADAFKREAKNSIVDLGLTIGHIPF